jgi:pyruvate dehydrogenase E1 component alpha subunit
MLSHVRSCPRGCRAGQKRRRPDADRGKTYRWRTHFEGETDTYRPPAEVQAWLKREPIAPYRRRLIETGVLTEVAADELEQEVVKEVAAAVEFARQSPDPGLESALADVWA